MPCSALDVECSMFDVQIIKLKYGHGATVARLLQVLGDEGYGGYGALRLLNLVEAEGCV